MTRSQNEPVRPFYLGIEGGATHTVALLVDARGQLVRRFDSGSANIKLLSDAQLTRLLRSITSAQPQPDAIAIGLAGARYESDWARIRSAAANVWPQIPCLATNDLETALAASRDDSHPKTSARVLILSGTGSCCYGRNASGKTAKVGGWGHILGDNGSGYQIGLLALKAVVSQYDCSGVWPKLGRKFLERLALNEPDGLINWIQRAEKPEVAALAVEVFSAAHKGDKIAADILTAAGQSLADDAVACARHLTTPRSTVRFILVGSVLLKQPGFAQRLATRLRKQWPNATVSNLAREGAWGAVALARKLCVDKLTSKKSRATQTPAADDRDTSLSELVKLSPTEQRNPRSRNLHKLPLGRAIKLMLSEDEKIPRAILAERKKIERAVNYIAQAFKRGGCLFYVGAGTSGRLGVLDASECPPTFRTDPEMVQGIIAGGQGALWRSVEGAEDDPLAGAHAIEFRGVNRHDVVVGIAASGRTPFVWGALGEARRRGAKTVLVSLNPFLKIPSGRRPDVVVAPNVGPEILTGSTRLKSGTATKLILNIFTTLAMVRIGKVISNLMVDLNPSNIKLRDRAVRIVRELKNVDYATAKNALESSGWIIKRACAKLNRRIKST
jgi:N-acetylmuramic acid 6-phosphate etherase